MKKLSRRAETKKGFSAILKQSFSLSRDMFLPAAGQTAPQPYEGFEHCTAYAHFPPVKIKSCGSDIGV